MQQLSKALEREDFFNSCSFSFFQCYDSNFAWNFIHVHRILYHRSLLLSSTASVNVFLFVFFTLIQELFPRKDVENFIAIMFGKQTSLFCQLQSLMSRGLAHLAFSVQFLTTATCLVVCSFTVIKGVEFHCLCTCSVGEADFIPESWVR